MNRQQTTARIGYLQDKQCRSCERNRPENIRSNFNPNDFCGGCDVYAELRALGERLTAITGERRKEKGIREQKAVRHYEKKDVAMTESEYMALKRKRVTELEISERAGVSIATFYKWRCENLSPESLEELKQIKRQINSEAAKKRHERKRQLKG